MPIDQLIIENFKSYLGKHVIGPFYTFTAVIGPNGSGKSNLMDAISFVLGVATRVLRSAKLSDLITSMSSGKDDDDKEPAKKHLSASVELVYKLDEKDKKSLGSDSKEEVIRFRRTISVKGVGAYYLGAHHVTQEEYEAKLRSIGVLVKARNFLVFQGDVESIASKTPAELCSLFEEISGSGELKAEYDAQMELHDEAEQALMAVFDKKRGATKEKKQMKDQKEHAERFKKALAEQKRLKLDFFLWQLFHLEKDMKHSAAELEELRAELGSRKDELKAAEGEVSEHGAGVAKLKREVATAEKEVAKQSKEIEKTKPSQIKTKEQIAFLQKAISSTEQDLKKAQTEFAKRAADTAALEQELKEVERLQAEAKARFETEAGKELKLATEQLAEYNRLKSEAGVRTAAIRFQCDKLKRDAQVEKERVAGLEAQIEALNERKKGQTATLQALTERREKMAKHIDDTRKNLTDESNKYEEIESKSRSASARQQKMSDELMDLTKKLEDIGLDRRQTQREVRFNEAVDAVKQAFPGVRGKLSDLCQPIQPKYNVAVTVALGKWYNSIVVDDSKTAIEVINYFRENRISQTYVIPLDQIKVPQLNESYRKLGGSIQLVIDCVQFDESNRKALLYVLENTLLCDELNEARKLAYGGSGGAHKYKIITLKGAVISKSGNMTGGSAPDDIISKARGWDDKEAAKLREKKAALFKQVVELEKVAKPSEDVDAMRVTIDGFKLRLKNSQNDQAKTNDKIKHCETEIKTIDGEIGKLTPALAAAQQSLRDKEAEVNQCTESVLKQEDEVFAAFSKKVGVRSIREYEEKAKVEAEKLAERQLELANRESKLRSQLEYDRRNDWNAPIAKLKKKLADDQKSLAKIQKELSGIEKQIEELTAGLKARSDALAKLQHQLDAANDKFKELKKNAAILSKSLAASEKKVISKEAAIDQQKAHRRELFRAAKLEGVDIPLEAGSASSSSADEKKGTPKKKGATPKKTTPAKAKGKGKGKAGSKRKRGKGDDDDDDVGEAEDDEGEGDDEDADADADDDAKGSAKKKRRKGAKDTDMEDDKSPSESPSQTESSEAERRSEDAKRIDFDSLVEHRVLHSAEEYEQVKRDFTRRLAALAGEIEQLAPNLHAASRFDEVKARLQSTNEEWEEKKLAAKTAADNFEKTKARRHALFSAAFDHVSKTIDGIYKELTIGTQFPSGGKAFLELENGDEPYLHGVKYSAMPPGKRFRDIDTLSGGEKTVAALALLFAIHSFHPAPFFVLDEVDAALDNINVDKVATYIRRRTARDRLQCVVISLKDTFYTKADALVGIYRDIRTKASGELTIDLTKYKD